jgi:hypothetical protein
VLTVVVLLESLILVAVRLVEDAVEGVEVEVVAVVTVTVTAFISGSDRNSDASTSCKPADAKDLFIAAAVPATSILMFSVV